MIEAELTKKEKVLAAAIKLFVADGFDKVSTADISKAAGVATGTMFHHFASKDDIIVTIYKTAKRAFISQTVIEQPTSDVKQDLQVMWRNLINWSLNHQNQFRYMQQFINSPYYTKEVMAQDDTWIALLDWWKAGIREKKFKAVPIEFLIKLFSSLLYSTIEFLIRRPDDKEACIKNSFLMCWDMVSLEPGFLSG